MKKSPLYFIVSMDLIDSEKAAHVHTRRVSAVNHLCFHYLVPNCEMFDYQVIDRKDFL